MLQERHSKEEEERKRRLEEEEENKYEFAFFDSKRALKGKGKLPPKKKSDMSKTKDPSGGKTTLGASTTQLTDKTGAKRPKNGATVTKR
jgi:hypothetical protein